MEILTREQLYELVWSEPVSDLAERLGASGRGLAKQCRRANIPVPPPGYWAKLDAGQTVERPRLPTDSLTSVNVVAVGKREFPAWNHLPKPETLAMVAVTAPAVPDDIDELRTEWRTKLKRVSIPSVSRNAHPLIASITERDAKRKESRWSYGYVNLTSRFEKRRIRLLNALFLALERMGGSIRVGDDRGRDLSVAIRGTAVPFRMDSPAVLRRRSHPSYGDRLMVQVGTAERQGLISVNGMTSVTG